MSNSSIYLSVIIPAYNEGERIKKMLTVVYNYLEHQDYSWEVIVVSDGSTDNTADVVRKAAADSSTETSLTRVIDRKENKGKGYTVREGMLAARGEIRLFTDADNSTDISHFDKMKPLFDEGVDVVICSREPRDAPGARQAVSQSWFKRLLGNAGNLVIRAVAVPGIRDTQCGFKAFKAEPAKKIFSQSVIDRWGFDIEALALVRLFGYKMRIIPAHWINDPKSHVTAFAYVEVLFETFKIRWNIIRGVYKK